MDGLDRDEVVWRKREQVRRGRRAENVEGRVKENQSTLLYFSTNIITYISPLPLFKAP